MHAVTFEETVDRVRRALAERPAAALEVPGFRPAAVLVPLLDRPTGPTLLFTRRTDRVPSHKGEISFPGGAREPGEDAVRAALRVPFEEVDPETGHWRIWSFHADPSRIVWGLTARILADLLDRAFRG